MDSSVKFNIDLEVLGLKDVDRAPQAVKAVATAVADIGGLLAPLGKIVDLLQSITGKLDKFGKVGEKSLDAVEDKAEDAQQELKDVGTAAEKAGQKVKASLFDKLGGMSFSFNNIISAAQNVASAVAPIFEEGMARQNAETTFGTLLGSKEEGVKYATELRNTTMATLYGAGTINDAAQNMLSFGIDSGKTQKMLTAIGDIAAGDAQKFGSLSLAFAQISSAGKLGGQDLMQLINAGFNPLAQMAEKTGKTIGQLKDEMAKGAISAKDVEEAFIAATSEGGQFAGMLDTIKSDTLGGQLAVVKSAFDDLKAKVFEGLLPVVKKFTPIITDNILPALSRLADFIMPIGEWIADNIDILGILVGTIGAVVGAVEIWTGVQSVLNVVMSANPISLVIIAIGALIALIAIVVKRYEEWGAAISFLLGPFGVLINVIMTVKRYWDDIVDAFQSDGIMAGLKRIGVMLLDVVLYPVQQLLDLLSNIPGLGNLAGKGADFIKGLREGLGAIDPKKDDKETGDDSNGTMESLMASVNGGNGGVTTDLSNATGTGTSSVASGGTRNTQITINLGNMVESINFQGGLEENKESLTSQLEETLMRVLYSAQMAV